MESRRCWLLMISAVVCVFSACRPAVNFSRDKKVEFKRVISIPDEAVIYMQNLALMRDKVLIPKGEHIELILPPRIIIESLQLRVGNKPIQTVNIRRGKTTRVRIRNARRYIQPGQSLVIEYLTWGLYWSAQYRVDILSQKEIQLQLGALIQNNWYNLAAMKVTLVAGWVGGSFQRASKEVPPTNSKLAFEKNVTPGKMIAALPNFLPRTAHPTYRHRVRYKVTPRVARSSYTMKKRKYRAFSSELQRRYKIRSVDTTASHRSSNYQKQFARYSPGVKQSNRVSGYALYPGLNVHMRRNERSLRWVSSVRLPVETRYVWPADQGDGVFIRYKFKNNSKILLPAGSAWMYQKRVFLGQDVCLWTPVGASSTLLTSNDGKVAVNKRIVSKKNNTQQYRFTIQNFSKRAIQMEVFERNPAVYQKGSLTFNTPPTTVNEKGQYHRWLLTIPAQQKKRITMNFIPTPKVRTREKAAK